MPYAECVKCGTIHYYSNKRGVSVRLFDCVECGGKLNFVRFEKIKDKDQAHSARLTHHLNPGRRY